MYSSHTDAISSTTPITNCAPAQAVGVFGVLVEAGWQGLPTTNGAMSTGSALMAHADGACSCCHPGPGFLLRRGGTKPLPTPRPILKCSDVIIVSEHSGRVDHATNNEMELMAIREAVSRAPLDADLEIMTDSSNAVAWATKGTPLMNGRTNVTARRRSGDLGGPASGSSPTDAES